MRTKRIILALLLCISLVLSTAVFGHAYSGILAFGDSLSDNTDADGWGLPSPYAPFTNGEVWVEYLADSAHLNVPLLSMAYGGATTGYDNPSISSPYTGLNWQVDMYLALYSSQISSSTLVTVWAGANDLFKLRSYETAADNVELALTKLATAGFQNFLVLSLPNIGATPAFSGTAESADATAWSLAFNTLLAADLVGLQLTFPGDHFYTLDTFSLINNMIANSAAYGLTNVTDMLAPDYYGTGYLFWDGVHPTTEGHQILANYAMASIPEPATIILLVLGLMGLAGVRRKFQK